MKLPETDSRVVILGKTGEGKTVCALWFLYMMLCANIQQIPFVIVDIKGDKLISRILKACGKSIREIDYGTVPKKPGLYYLKVNMLDDLGGLEEWLIKVYKQGNCGLFIDEGYALPRNSKAFTAILTQGRALNIPVIILYQRPVYMTKFAVAQADFFVALRQNIKEDLLTTYEYMPLDIEADGQLVNAKSTLPKYYFLYYDVSENEMQLFRPVPSPDKIVSMYKALLKPQSQTTRSRVYV
jgi:hypothetical protein